MNHTPKTLHLGNISATIWRDKVDPLRRSPRPYTSETFQAIIQATAEYQKAYGDFYLAIQEAAGL